VVDETAIGGQGRDFPNTRWTLILTSRDGEAPRRKALEELLTVYWKPLYFYVRRKGHTIEGAKDIIQGFFVHLLERDFLSRLDPGKGRFRGYLKTAADNYLANLHEHNAALKRGGAVKTVALDFDLAEKDLGSAPDSADAAYDREWAAAVLQRAMDNLKAEFADGKRKGPFDLVLKFFNPEPPTYEAAAKQSGMTVVQFKAFLHRARVRYKDLLRAEVAQTLAEAGQADSEIAELLKTLQ